MTANSLIDSTMERINRVYRPGTLSHMKRFHPDEWKRLVALEGEINKLAIKGDTEGLKKGLMEYQRLILGIMKMERPKSPGAGEGWKK